MEARSQDRAFCFLVRGISGVSTQPAQVLGLKHFPSRTSDEFRLKDGMTVWERLETLGSDRAFSQLQPPASPAQYPHVP
jgi:hypothetical protein